MITVTKQKTACFKKYGEIVCGDTFTWAGGLYLKSEGFQSVVIDRGPNATRCGGLTAFDSTDMVEMVDLAIEIQVKV